MNFLQAIAPIASQFGRRPQCNCLKMVNFQFLIIENKQKKTSKNHIGFQDDIPIPRSESECYSPEYVATLRNFIEVNFSRTSGAYNSNKNLQCDYLELQNYVEQFKVNSLAVAKLLEKNSPTFVELDRLSHERKLLVRSYVPAIRQYVLDNDKSCYDVPRIVRPNPMKISLEAITILSKCIGYRDKC